MFQGCTNTVKYDDTPASKTVQKEVGADTISNNATAMLDAMLLDPEVQKATKSSRPKLAVFGLINFTYDKLDLAAINGQLMNELNKANRFRFSDQEDMSAESEKWKDSLYQLFEDPASGQSLATAVAADYLLVGEISNVIRTQPKQKKVFYRLSLKLLDQSNGETIWREQRELLKSEKNIVYGI
ncbi:MULTISPECIES: penicillin-binding protein activator LpoB [unclassified Ketobacter]|uniref:penicillin-binding protein activator LpoB n=1 Tax=unclassified Ketobacter TaxID=2639109 RepID=UPI0025BEB61A|nr:MULTISPECIES: hypothetical protein [unclassified Ketobacter]MCK5790513.1 hypothetical protein [Ketobacter sp.]